MRLPLSLTILVLLASAGPALRAAEPVTATDAPLTAPAAAAPVAIWAGGPGAIAGASATTAASVPDGAVVLAGDTIASLTLARAPAAKLYLSPGTQVRIHDRDGRCTVELDRGTLQMDVGDRGPYQTIHVVGAALDVAVTGTLFLVERDAADRDFLALVDGKVNVRLKDDVRRLLDEEESSLDLIDRQSILASARGLGGVEDLAARPQLPGTSGGTGIRQQAVAGAGTGWATDLADASSDGSGGTGEGGLGGQIQTVIADQIQTQVGEQVTQAVTDTVQQQVITGSGLQPLAGPPGVPSP